jgi:hypothetical protein
MLKNLWTSPNSEFAYSGVTKIKDFYKNEKKNINIENELAEIRTYSRHKEAKKIKKFNPFFVYFPHDMWQIDLMYLPDLAKYNEGYKYLLCLLDVFSRKLYIKILKDKSSQTVTNAFDELQKKINTFPKKIVCDMGTEFKCRQFIEYCKKNKIKLIFVTNDTKAANVERAQRSFQGILYRILEEKQSKKYIDYLEDTLHIYNRRKNRITGFPPNEAIKKENLDSVQSNLNKYYGEKISEKKSPKYKKGDPVRVLEKRGKFARGYQPYFSEEVFKIKNILLNLPQPRYVLSSFDGSEQIIGTFYEREITKASHEEYKVEKIIKSRKYKGKKQFFVKWMGYSDVNNSWVDEKDI